MKTTIADEVSRILARLVKKGRSYGIHVLMASQTRASTSNLSRGTTDQMRLRIPFSCSDTESRLILGEDNPAASLLGRKGEAIYNSANGVVEGNTFSQIFWLSADSRRDLLQKLREKLDQSGLPRPNPPIVFEGNAPTELESNKALLDFINAENYPENLTAAKAWLGEQIAIAPHTFARFRRQSRSNLLILGQSEVEATSMLVASILSLAAQQSPTPASFTIINLSHVDADWHDLPKQLAEALPHTVSLPKPREVGDTLEKIANEVERRSTDAGTLIEPSFYLVILGLHRARDLRTKDSYTLSVGAEHLLSILRDGPEIGIHVICWCDTYNSFLRVFERRTLDEFDMRVALQMSADDSLALIDNELANNLGDHRAYYHEEERATLLPEKFRPYALPEVHQIEKLGKKLRQKAELK